MVSSANKLVRSFVHLGISEMKIRKSRGPRMLPCGTPHVISRRSDKNPLKEVACVLSVR